MSGGLSPVNLVNVASFALLVRNSREFKVAVANHAALSLVVRL